MLCEILPYNFVNIYMMTIRNDVYISIVHYAQYNVVLCILYNIYILYAVCTMYCITL